MQPQEFAEYHRLTLEQDEVKHNKILGSLGRLAANYPSDLRRWTVGGPGARAVQARGYPIILGEVTPAQCLALVDEVRDLDFPGVVGPDRTAQWFVERATELGLAFLEPIPQQIHALSSKPNYPGVPGHARKVEPPDAELFANWKIAFLREATPHDPLPVASGSNKPPTKADISSGSLTASRSR
jgi:hypothetical protein